MFMRNGKLKVRLKSKEKNLHGSKLYELRPGGIPKNLRRLCALPVVATIRDPIAAAVTILMDVRCSGTLCFMLLPSGCVHSQS